MSMHDILAAAIAAANAAQQPTQPEPPSPDVLVLDEPAPLVTPPDVPQYQPHAAPQIKTLADKAMLVKLTRKMFSPYAFDKDATDIVTSQTGINAGRFNKHLFKRPNALVRKVNATFTAAYQYHKQHTLPWETGVDLLRADLYMEYTAQMRKHIDACNNAVSQLAAVWDQEVADDMAHLGSLAKLSDYPVDISRHYGIDVRFRPVPTVGDFRCGISDEDRASLERDIRDAEHAASAHVIESLLEPMTAAAKRLVEYQGNKGERFHAGTILNMLEVADRMAKVNISDDPVIAQRIADLRATVGQYATPTGIEALKRSSTVRQTAKAQIDQLMANMAGLV